MVHAGESRVVGEDGVPVRVMRREWRRHKPHLRKSDSLPSLSLLPTKRPTFTCRHCGFTNTQIPMCLWCCWTSKEAETEFDNSMPRARRISAPTRITGRTEGAEKRRKDAPSYQNGLSSNYTPVTPESEKREPKKHKRNISAFSGSAMNQIKAWDLGRFRIRDPSKKPPNGNAESTNIQSNTGSGPWGAGRSPAVLADGPPHINGRTDDGGLGLAEDLVQEEKGAYKVGSYSELKAGEGVPANCTQNEMPTPNKCQPLPLRLRRLKGSATPLYIDPQAQIRPTHATGSTPSLELQAATKSTAKSLLSARIFRKKSSFTLRRTPSIRSNRISDPESNEQMVIITEEPSPDSQKSRFGQPSGATPRGILSLPTAQTSAISNTTMSTPTTPTTSQRSATNPDVYQYYPYLTSPTSPSALWSRSDPFGELLALNDAARVPSPAAASRTQTPITPTSPTISTMRERAWTESAIPAAGQLHYRYPSTSTPPASPAGSGYGISFPKPLYSAIRKNGVCLSPPLPSPSMSTFTFTSTERLKRENNTLNTTNTSSPLSPSYRSPLSSSYPSPNRSPYLSPHFSSNPSPDISPNLSTYLPPHPPHSSPNLSPNLSPISPFFPLYPPSGDQQLLSLTPESRPSSVSTSSHGDASCGPLSLLRARYGEIKSRSKPQHNKSRSGQESLRTRGSMGSNTTGRTGVMEMPTRPVYQRMFQVPVGGIGAGIGCSMSGETELKLALAGGGGRSGGNSSDGYITNVASPTPMATSMSVSNSVSLDRRERELPPIPSLGSRIGSTFRSGLSASSSLTTSLQTKPGEVVRKLKEMVSRTF